MTKPIKDPFKENFDTLEEFADRISEVLNCPITIEDANHRLLAYSTHDERTDQARIATIIGRRVPEKVINNLWKEGIIPKLLETNEPVRVKNINEIGLGDRIAISIWKNEEVLGFIWAVEIEKALGNEEVELLKKAANVLKNKLLQLQIRKYKREERSQEFFWKLLTGHIKSRQEISEAFYEAQITAPSTFSIAIFRFQEDITPEAERQISYMLKTMHRLKIVLYTIDCNDLILLLSLDAVENPLDEQRDFADYFRGNMYERFDVTQIKASCSSIYSSHDHIEKSYKEALNVLDMKSKFPEETKEIINYQELGIYQFLDVILEKRVQDQFENHSLKKLTDYDLRHNSNLVETLEVFLNNDNNINEAAKELNVHMNTLSYRLKRISEIGDINLKDVNQKMTLYIDIKLMKYKK
ncbi:PucR family transcriptional regulator [Priestia megaterium]|jgi:DNA-binding PucR family transcriptional regulator|uniref:PucR family transcriptional regulator n=9 Tax=Priestia TaxID=2800373 RepID=D5DWM4_PRIM1|nr:MULTISPECIES: PucR family transcriptional regulator [Priestia]AVX11047.1 PucR family transcriptional regulator [Bacillus sp. Y-01]KOP77108.1 PucR family transcriptional regulator [Bacillus sp. FJAT-21351]KQU18091.1 PucR family transcriptional regulator [Bacillus sp. Leaf75]MBZ5481759.1 PucR family transcriptional regulator [Bacillus sp. T_4]MDH6651792.1 DNA-binding PucR family transcriptional regulator [Bacillus sp. PvP124]MDP9578923.1 DNA-binding PucR family transcriptional regulator [Bac